MRENITHHFLDLEIKFNLPNHISIKICHSIKGLGQNCVLLFQKNLMQTSLFWGPDVKSFLETYLSRHRPFKQFLVLT